MKNVIKVLVLAIILSIISYVVVFAFGKTYTTKALLFNGNYNIEIDNSDDGEIEIIGEYIKDETLFIKIKSKKPGKVDLIIDYGDIESMQVFYVHKNMVITDNNYFGKSTCSEIIPISMFILLTYILYLITFKFRKDMKENLFQYKNVGHLAIIIFLTIFDGKLVLSLFNYQGIYESFNSIISLFTSTSLLLLPIAIITFSLVTISNIQLLIKEGRSVKNLLGVFLGIFLILCTLLPDFVYKKILETQVVDIFNLNSPGPYIYSFIESMVYVGISYLECVLIATIMISIKSVKRKINHDKDYIIILGCQIKKDGTLTPLLKGRVDKALEFRNEQLEETKKDLVFIPSGGKGPDEKISEALAIKNYLRENGINKKNIIIDDKSTNTYENIKYSYKLMKKKNPKVLISTTNYHVFRAGLMATSLGLVLDGIGSKTKAYFWINAFIREFVGTLYAEKKKHIIMICLIALSLIGIIYVTYLANNI